MTKMTGEDVLSADVGLQRINDFAFKPEHFKLADRLARAQRKNGKVARRIEKRRQAIVRQYAEKDATGALVHILDKEGQPIDVKIRPADYEAFQADIDALMDAEYEIEAAPFTVAEIEGIKATIKPSTLALLGPLYEGNHR